MDFDQTSFCISFDGSFDDVLDARAQVRDGAVVCVEHLERSVKFIDECLHVQHEVFATDLVDSK